MMERDDGQAVSCARTSIAHEGLESRGRDERLHKNALAAAARRIEPLHRITDLREVRRPPRCSRSAVHAHHIVYRSAGGSDGPANLTSLRAAHHLHGVHMGYVRVRGKAPDALQWHLGP